MSTWFGHGRLRLYLLNLLDDGPKHGYEVMRLMEDRTLGMYAPSAGTIYPRLQRLEQEGLVTHTKAEGGRKVYAITDAGRAELRRRESELAELEQELRENILGVADEIRGEVRESLRDLKDQLDQSARRLRSDRNKVKRGWHDWLNDWTAPPSQPGRPAPAASRDDMAGSDRSDAASWPVGDFEQALQRFAERARTVAYRTPIDAEDVAAAAAVLEDALGRLRSILAGRHPT